MKKVFAILLLLPLVASAQSKNDNTIIAKGVVFKTVVNKLLDAGYLIDKSDSNFLTIRTEYKTLCKNCIPEIMFNIRIKDSAAIITGKWRSNGGVWGSALTGSKEFIYFDVINEKPKAGKMCFLEMDKIAKLFSSSITYTRQ